MSVEELLDEVVNMIQAKCIQKFRDKSNRIYGYRLIDLSGNTKDITSDDLKKVISAGKIVVINLKLTSDGRLVDVAENSIKNMKINTVDHSKYISKEDMLECGIHRMLDLAQDKFIGIVGSGDKFCGEDFYIDDDDDAIYACQMLGVYYDNKSEMYGCTFGVEGRSNGGIAYIMFQDKEAMGKDIISDQIDLTLPLVSETNSNEINDMFISFAKKVKRWIHSQQVNKK